MKNNPKNHIEDANSENAILKVSATTSFDVDVYSVITFKQKLDMNKILIRIDGRFLDNLDYGNLLGSYEILRIYTELSNEKWVDIKIIKSYYDPLYIADTVIEGIIISGNFQSIIIGNNVVWGFSTQNVDLPPDFIKLDVYDVTTNSALISWSNISSVAKDLIYQIKFREEGVTSWTYSTIGNWITDFRIDYEATDLPAPTRQYLGKNVLWLETSEPEIHPGNKSSAWVEIHNGNFKQLFFQNMGSGYKKLPTTNLYYDNPNLTLIHNPRYRKEFYSSTEIVIEKVAHGFLNGDVVDFTGKMFNSTHKIYDVTPDSFKISSPSFDMLIADNILTQAEGQIKLSKINVKTQGIITPILVTKKFNIQGLSSNKKYECSVVPYYSYDLKLCGEYINILSFITN